MSLYQTSTFDWDLDSVPWERIELSLIKQRTDLFYILTAASFVDITADLYAGNLAIYFSDYPEIVEWLSKVWEKEEVRHGQTLRKYVNTVWPEFDWEKSYASFYSDYSQTCEISSYEKIMHLRWLQGVLLKLGQLASMRLYPYSLQKWYCKELLRRFALKKLSTIKISIIFLRS